MSLNVNFFKVDKILTKYRIHKDALASKNYHLHWEERDKLMEKFNLLFPKLTTKYKLNFDNWNFGTKLTKIHYLLLNNRISEAKIILKTSKKSLKICQLLILSYLPKKFIKYIFKLKKEILDK